MNIDFRLLRIQYKWLLTMPECDEREGLLNFIESLCGIDESHKQESVDALEITHCEICYDQIVIGSGTPGVWKNGRLVCETCY